MKFRQNLINSLCKSTQVIVDPNIDNENEECIAPVRESCYSSGIDVKFCLGQPITIKSQAISYELSDKTTKQKEDKVNWSNGSSYIGEMTDSLRHGFGKYKDPNINSDYEGNWYLGLKHGLGKLVYFDESYYEGFFAYGIRSGKGLIAYSSGNLYVGEWKLDKKNGFGKMYWISTNQKYVGFWKNNLQEGFGQCTWNVDQQQTERLRPTKYIGFWRVGKMDGYGVFYLSNGEILLGSWSEGKKEGYFTLIDANGNEKEYLFEADKIVDSVKRRIQSKQSAQQERNSIRTKSQRITSGSIEAGNMQKNENKLNPFLVTCFVQNKEQSLEEMNYYRGIICSSELFDRLSSSAKDKEILIENVILIFIRYDSTLKTIFNFLKNKKVDQNKNNYKEKVTLRDFVRLFESFEKKSPFLNEETFTRFYLENKKNRLSTNFDFENYFKKILNLRLLKNGSAVSTHDFLFLQYFDFKIDIWPRESKILFGTEFLEIWSEFELQRKERKNMLEGLGCQLEHFEQLHEIKNLLETPMEYYNFTDAILRSAFLSTNYSFRNFENTIQRILAEDFVAFKNKIGSQSAKLSDRNRGFKTSRENDLATIQQTLKAQNSALSTEDIQKSHPVAENKTRPIESSLALKVLNVLVSIYRFCENSSRIRFANPPKTVLLKQFFAIFFEFCCSDFYFVAAFLADFAVQTQEKRKMSEDLADFCLNEEVDKKRLQSIELAVEASAKTSQTYFYLRKNIASIRQSFNSFVFWPEFFKIAVKIPNLEIFISLAETYISQQNRVKKEKFRRKWKPYQNILIFE